MQSNLEEIEKYCSQLKELVKDNPDKELYRKLITCKIYADRFPEWEYSLKTVNGIISLYKHIIEENSYFFPEETSLEISIDQYDGILCILSKFEIQNEFSIKEKVYLIGNIVGIHFGRGGHPYNFNDLISPDSLLDFSTMSQILLDCDKEYIQYLLIVLKDAKYSGNVYIATREAVKYNFIVLLFLGEQRGARYDFNIKYLDNSSEHQYDFIFSIDEFNLKYYLSCERGYNLLNENGNLIYLVPYLSFNESLFIINNFQILRLISYKNYNSDKALNYIDNRTGYNYDYLNLIHLKKSKRNELKEVWTGVVDVERVHEIKLKNSPKDVPEDNIVDKSEIKLTKKETIEESLVLQGTYYHSKYDNELYLNKKENSVKLGDITEIIYGIGIAEELFKPIINQNRIPVINGNFPILKYIDKHNITNYKKNIVTAGDIIISIYPSNRTEIFVLPLIIKEALLGHGLIAFHLITQQHDPYKIITYLKSSKGRAQIERLFEGLYNAQEDLNEAEAEHEYETFILSNRHEKSLRIEWQSPDRKWKQKFVGLSRTI